MRGRMLLQSRVFQWRSHCAAFKCCVVAIGVGLIACGGSATDSVAPPSNNAAASIAITPSAPPAVTLGSQLALQAEVHDPNGQVVPGATVFWSSLDTTVATVTTTGVVTGKAIGSTQVAASSGGQSAVVPVAVVAVPVASVALVPAVANVVVGGTVTLQAVTYDAGGQVLTGRSVVWATSASQVATVDNSGKVTGVTAGNATITGTCEGKAASASVTVTLIPVAAVTVSPGSASLLVGRSASLSAVTTDANGNVLSGRSVSWSSANTAVATVSNLGLVTAVGAGSTTIDATSEGKTGVAQVVVTLPPPAPVASVSLAPATATLQIGTATALVATLRDSAGTTLSGRTITWATSAPTVATVSSTGVVTATGAGTAVIAATSEGKSGTASVTVPDPPPVVTVASVRVTPATVSLRSNRTYTLTAKAYDSSGRELAGRSFTWSSSNADAVPVTQTGPATATVTAGTRIGGPTTITATCDGVSGTSIVTFAG